MPINSNKEATILNPDTTKQDFIDLSKVFDSVKRHWLTLFACVLAAMICAAILAKVLPARWEASTVLQIGQIPSNSGPRDVALIEQPPQAAERLKQRELQNKVLTAIGYATDERLDARSALVKKTLKAIPVKNTNFIQITVAGFSPEEAQKILGTAANALIASHDKLYAPAVKRLATQLQENVRQTIDAKAERAHLQSLLSDVKKTKTETLFAQNIVAVNLLANKESELLTLRTERVALENISAHENTYSTSIIDAVHASDTAYFPKLGLFLATGAFLGLLLGLGVALLRDKRQGKL